MATSTTTVRLSPVKTRRQGAPFVNFFSTSSHTHPDPAPSTWQENGRGGGWGTKHVLDDAPFDFWVEEEHQFRLWSAQENEWIRTKYGAHAIAHCGNFLIIETNSPPNPVPLTVGGFPTMFVPLRLPGEPLYDPCPLRHNTNYASPRVPDPVTSFRVAHWLDPTKDQMEIIAHELCQISSVKRINYIWEFIIVELEADGRTYESHSLPGIVAGCTTVYHHSDSSYWEGMARRRRWITPSVAQDIQDVTNYLITGSRELQPGVRLSSSLSDINGEPQMSLATTSGVLLRNGSQARMTCALHGWPNSNDVFHPQASSGELIGLVRERYDAEDVGLVELNPSIRFTNHKYFEATPPRRLLTSGETRRMRGHWYLADGISTGCVAMLQSGIIQELPRRPPGHTITFTRWKQEQSVYSQLYAMIGATGAHQDVADGLCGAAIVEDSGGSNGVGGFFQLEDGQWCIAPCLDQIIADGWLVV